MYRGGRLISESRGLTRRDRFQVLADQINMPVRQKRCRRFVARARPVPRTPATSGRPAG